MMEMAGTIHEQRQNAADIIYVNDHINIVARGKPCVPVCNDMSMSDSTLPNLQ